MASIPQGSALGPTAETKPLGEQIRAIIKPLASLKIAVTVFSLSLFLILVGSLAQARTDIWEVVGQYFRCWVAWVDVKDFFPPAFFPPLKYPNLAEGLETFPIQRFPFPGGWSLGLVATINLLAAHGLRFKIQAKGTRLYAGLAALIAGLGITWIVVASGMNADGFQTTPMLSYQRVWVIFQVLTVLGICWVAWKSLAISRSLIAKGLILTIAVGLCGVAIINKPLTDASMRILWQLMKAEFASLVLLWACWLLFKKRSGVVLLHAGVAVLMLSEVMVGLTVSENQFQMWEGETANYVFDTREREIVVIDNSGEESKVVSIPERMIVAAAAAEDPDDRIIQDERLPFDIELVEFYRNSQLRRAEPGDDNLSTAGSGVRWIAEAVKKGSGMDSTVDISAAYVRLLRKEDNKALGTYMLRAESPTEPILAGGTIFDVGMRFKRTYKPYTVTLLDVQKNDYLGTSTPRDYSSMVRLLDKENNVDRKVRIWMNNPLRYRGETLYQTSYNKNQKGTEAFDPSREDGAEMTSLQVVNNRGWMLPYMACMIVLTGMAVQFGMALVRYQNRKIRANAPDTPLAAGATAAAQNALANPATKTSGSGKALAWSIVLGLVVAGYFGSKFRVKKTDPDQANIYAFGKIPVVKGGRQQPLSSVAMNRLRVLTNGKTAFNRELRQDELTDQWGDVSQDVVAAIPGLEPKDLDAFEGDVSDLVRYIAAGKEMDEREVYARLAKRSMSGNSAITRKTPALWWYLDVISGREEAQRHRVLRIDEPQLLQVLDLAPRDGATYSVAEVMQHWGELQGQLEQASKQFSADADKATRFQRRLLKLANNMSRISQSEQVFSTLEPGRLQGSLLRRLEIQEILKRMGATSDSALVLQIPRPDKKLDGKWESIPLTSVKNDLLKIAAKEGAKDIDGLATAVMNQLPDELVLGGLEDMIEQLNELKARAPEEPQELNKLAAKVIPELGPDAFKLKELLTTIAATDKKTAKEIFDDLSEEQRARIYEVSAADVLLSWRSEVSPEAVQATQDFFGSENVSIAGINKRVHAYTAEIAAKLFTDEDVATGPSKHLTRFLAIMDAWKNDDIKEFNRLVEDHNTALAATDFADVDTSRTSFEAWFNHAAPSYYCAVMYLTAFALACLSLVVWDKTLGRAAFTITLVTFGVHTFTLIARIYISGRPPVTNLYSSAVFIGWGAVLLGLIFEFVNKRGIGNLVSTAAGAATLVIAYFLGKDGDTFEVLQAVLDTQFWLATHVVCITLGYSATFLAGLFGIVYIMMGVFTPSLRDNDRKELSRMIYGTICFAMLFSFVGTILGGLWADDSWGRFWGWDPKENGAMMIVIWNAIVMHARWDNMIKDRGMAVLSVIGNVVTAWSWFGVNELRAGLHSYGFTEGRLYWLIVFVLSQLLIVSIGLFPKDMWRSFRKDGEVTIA